MSFSPSLFAAFASGIAKQPLRRFKMRNLSTLISFLLPLPIPDKKPLPSKLIKFPRHSHVVSSYNQALSNILLLLSIFFLQLLDVVAMDSQLQIAEKATQYAAYYPAISLPSTTQETLPNVTEVHARDDQHNPQNSVIGNGNSAARGPPLHLEHP